MQKKWSKNLNPDLCVLKDGEAVIGNRTKLNFRSIEDGSTRYCNTKNKFFKPRGPKINHKDDFGFLAPWSNSEYEWM